MTPDALRDLQAQGEAFFSEGVTWEHVAVMIGMILLTWLLWRRP